MKTKRLKAKERKNINKRLSSIDTYCESIPIGTIEEIITEESGYILLNEDNTHFSAIFCGREGRADISIGHYDGAIFDMLHLSWYKMSSGRYEIVSYVG